MRRNAILRFFRVLFKWFRNSTQTPIVFTGLGAMDIPSVASCFQQKRKQIENALREDSPEIFSLHSSFVSYLYSHFFTSLHSLVNSLLGG